MLDDDQLEAIFDDCDMSDVTHGDESLVVYPGGSDPPRYYCRLYTPRDAHRCAVTSLGGGIVEAVDGGGGVIWILAGASLPRETAEAVLRAFESGAPPPLPFAPALVYSGAASEFVGWSGPEPELRDEGGVAVELRGPIEGEPAETGVWNALTIVTVGTPEWLAYVASHPLPSLHALRVEVDAGTASLQAVLDAHPSLSLLDLDGEAALTIASLSAPGLRRLWLGFEADPGAVSVDDEVNPAERARMQDVVAGWTLGEDVEVTIQIFEYLATEEPGFFTGLG